MGFVRDAANVGTFGLAGKLLGNKKKPEQRPMPTMISTTPYQQPMSMIGGTRAGR